MSCKVSISITTYNQQGFVAQAIESVLMQKTDFDYEIIIGEDDSSDRTREIVKAYQEKYPDKIRLFLNSRDNVIYIDGRPTGRWNFVNNLTHAQGQYVALLEGDDYWTSPDKLQSQVDFLDSHPSCAICFHPVVRCYENENRAGRVAVPSLTKEIYTIGDLLKGNFISTCSVMLRNGLFGEFPDWYFSVEVGDWPLYILSAQYGDIGYINRVMAIYRVHSGGIRSLRSAMYKIQANIATLETIRQHLGPQLDPEYHQTLDDSIARRHLQFMWALARRRDFAGVYSYVSDLLPNKQVSKKSLARATIGLLGRKIG